MKLTPKQKAFADYYIELGNATQAAIKAGYSKKYVATNTDKLLKNTNVKNYIDERMKKIEDDRIADAKEVMMYLTSVLRGESEAAVVVVEGTGEGCSEARTMTKTPNERERLKAAELIGKRYGIFTDKIEHEEKPIEIIIKRKE